MQQVQSDVMHRLQNSQIIILALLLLLACGPLNQLQELNRKGRALATGVAILGNGNYLAFEAYEKLNQLPGYRLESRNTIRDSAGNLSTYSIISRYDANGNVHTLIQTADGRQHEIYVVDGHTYTFEAKYNGWVDMGNIPPEEAPHPNSAIPTAWRQFSNPIQLLSQFGAVPTEAGQETLQNRPTTRYTLEYVAADLAQTFGNPPNRATADLHGTLWVDNQTGALLKSEIFFYATNARQPSHEFLLETSQIGGIEPITTPEPVVNPAAVASATATAQAWSVLQMQLNYQGAPIAFKVVPLEIDPAANGIDRNAQMHLVLRQLPQEVLAQADVEPFLTYLGQQLTLSIPRHNLVVTSSGFQIENVDTQKRSIEVIYQFEADLKDFSHVELILTGTGNPVFAPVPVAGHE